MLLTTTRKTHRTHRRVAYVGRLFSAVVLKHSPMENPLSDPKNHRALLKYIPRHRVTVTTAFLIFELSISARPQAPAQDIGRDHLSQNSLSLSPSTASGRTQHRGSELSILVPAF